MYRDIYIYNPPTISYGYEWGGRNLCRLPPLGPRVGRALGSEGSLFWRRCARSADALSECLKGSGTRDLQPRAEETP